VPGQVQKWGPPCSCSLSTRGVVATVLVICGVAAVCGSSSGSSSGIACV
jgi:hypothetical protein